MCSGIYINMIIIPLSLETYFICIRCGLFTTSSYSIILKPKHLIVSEYKHEKHLIVFLNSQYAMEMEIFSNIIRSLTGCWNEGALYTLYNQQSKASLILKRY